MNNRSTTFAVIGFSFLVSIIIGLLIFAAVHSNKHSGSPTLNANAEGYVFCNVSDGYIAGYEVAAKPLYHDGFASVMTVKGKEITYSNSCYFSEEPMHSLRVWWQ